MCGIAGVYSLRRGAPPPERSVLKAMADRMVHRGPDDDGYHVAPGVGLAMRRLSIIDLAGGKQPLYSEDGKVAAVLNGEIYNFQSLRADLEARGHRFATHSDTEVLVHGYEEEGPAYCDRLVGMFGFAVHDARTDRLMVVRDRLGIKPLYYGEFDGQLLFASEMKSLLAHPAVTPRVDPTALDLFLALGYVPAPYSILQGIRKLLPGHRLVAERGGVRVERWWSVPAETEPTDHATAVRRVRELLADAVKLRCIADVPLGAFLSGGIDSSAIVGLMRETGQDPVRTFSIGFEDASYDETEYSRVIAARYRTEHTEERIGPDSWKLTRRLARFLDEPFADTSLYPTYLVSQFARKHVTVALSGDGGDELFGGYHWYLAEALDRRWRRVPAPLRRLVERCAFAFRPTAKKRGLVNSAQRFLQGSRLPAQLGHMRWLVHADEAQRRGLRGPALLGADPGALGRLLASVTERDPGLEPLVRAMFVDLQLWLPDDILTKVDRMSMAVSLEARVPFLDHRLVEYVARLPQDLRIKGSNTKVVLREAVKDLVPPDVLRKPKEGFSIPMKNWLRAELRGEAEAVFDPARLKRHDFLDANAVQALWRSHAAGDANHAHVLFAILMFDLWHEEVVDRVPAAICDGSAG